MTVRDSVDNHRGKEFSRVGCVGFQAMQEDRLSFSAAIVRTALIAGAIAFLGPASLAHSASPTASIVPLPKVEQWSYESIVARDNAGKTELELTVNYQNGRVASPPAPARRGELFTLVADVASGPASPVD